MAEQRRAGDGIHERGAGTALKRRGILAAAGAVVAGIVAKQAAQPVAAAFALQGDFDNAGSINTNIHSIGSKPPWDTSSADDKVVFSVNNTGTGSGYNAVGISVTTPNFGIRTKTSSNGWGIEAIAQSGVGVSGTCGGPNGTGVYGSASTGTGVYGESNGNTFSKGVHGKHLTNGYGVYGEASDGGYGVTGVGTTERGVFGQSNTGNGVIGQSSGGNGVYGYAGAAGAASVVAGVFGDSTTTYGIIGRTTASGYSGLTAITGTPGVAALAATATVNTAYAAYFQGNTVVQGNFAVVGGNKSAAVKDASGQHRLVYCMESPEAWFEDFGEAKVVAGKADVKLDPVFAQIAHTDAYHVFLTPYSGLGALRVGARRGDGFAVEEIGGASSGAFSYRVVAKRKDITGERLAKFTPPKINIPDESKLPKPAPPRKA